MQTARTLLIMGIWIAILPYLGFPIAIKNLLFVLTGFILIYLSLLFYKQVMRLRKKKAKSFDNFSENNPKDTIQKTPEEQI